MLFFFFHDACSSSCAASSFFLLFVSAVFPFFLICSVFLAFSKYLFLHARRSAWFSPCRRCSPVQRRSSSSSSSSSSVFLGLFVFVGLVLLISLFEVYCQVRHHSWFSSCFCSSQHCRGGFYVMIMLLFLFFILIFIFCLSLLVCLSPSCRRLFLTFPFVLFDQLFPNTLPSSTSLLALFLPSSFSTVQRRSSMWCLQPLSTPRRKHWKQWLSF